MQPKVIALEREKCNVFRRMAVKYVSHNDFIVEHVPKIKARCIRKRSKTITRIVAIKRLWGWEWRLTKQRKLEGRQKQDDYKTIITVAEPWTFTFGQIFLLRTRTEKQSREVVNSLQLADTTRYRTTKII